jgi:ABC-2 type transport system ATP-binding protein
VSDLRGEASLLVRAKPLPAALAVAQRVAGDERVSIVDGALYVPVQAGCAPELTRALVQADVEVLEVRPQARTLEDVFFQMTGADKETKS